jgi:L-iditol 2-dehydrogenase
VKAFQLTALREMKLLDVPDPQIHRPHDVLLKLGAVGVCGSDIHYYATGRIGSLMVEYPFTVGHECAGTVVEVGEAVTRVRAGSRVAIEPAMVCGTCDQCRAGRENTCRHNRFLGCPGQAEGSLSEYIVMPEENCFPITDDLGMGAATVSEPLAIAIYAVRQSGLKPGTKIGILGMGPIGRTVLIAARHAGASAVYGTDRIDERCAAAQQAGASWIGNPDRGNVVAEILEREPLGLDIVYECCGQQKALDQALDLLRPGGTLMLIGIPELDRVSLASDKMRRKELTLKNVRRQRGCVEAALELIDQRRAEIDALITHRFAFGQTDAAFDQVANYRDGVVKAMIEFDC